MLIHISQKNKSNGHKRCWTFYTRFDYSFDVEKANNVLVFSRFAEYDKKGKPLRTYDAGDGLHKNCSWKQAEPSQKIIDKAWQKFMESWTISVNKRIKD